MEARNRAFQQLKPVCIKLSDSALKLMGRDGSTQDVIDNIQALQRVLRLLAAQDQVLDTKLADYVFFPLSSALKQLEKLPVRGKESLFSCIHVLLRTAWARELPPELGLQLLILYSFVADQKGSKHSEELQIVVFQSMRSVFRSLNQDETRRQALLATKTIPHVGKALSVILDGCLDGPSEQVQVASLEALDAFCHAVQDREAIGISFLPGIMSCLTKVLSFQSSAKTNSKALVMALETLTFLLPYVFSDDFTEGLASGNVTSEKGLTTSWLKATTSQIRISLATILKLQQYDRQNVRLALSRLCCELLQKCSTSMKDSVAMLLEGLLTIASSDAVAKAELKHLLSFKSSFGDLLRSSLHYWIISLPRIMQSADDTKKQRRISQISSSFRLLSEQGLDMSIIQKDLAANLRGSVMLTIMERTSAPSVGTTELRSTSLDLIMEYDRRSDEFGEIMSLQRGQQDTLRELLALIYEISRDGAALDTARDLTLCVADMSGQQQLANFWLALNLLRNSLDSTSGAEIDEFVSFPDENTRAVQEILEQLYDFSVSLLGETSLASQTDWRLRALALEVLALQASQQKADFRGELIDALYPILHHLGASEQLLQRHAITCLNMVASNCGYKSSGDMIIANADYLVNAVALRLNTFDISPQAPQVLLMMVRLAGPSVLPYLDDTVESIFVALESFHGYPRLVDLLFSVLKAIVEEGVKSSQFAITEGNLADDRQKRQKRIPTIEEVAQEVHHLRKRYKEDLDADLPEVGHPERPWGIDKPKSPNEEAAAVREAEEAQPPAPRTYAMLLNISRLTQHYLTSASPQLRTSLLDLLTSSFPALAKHENSFLPLINTLWPVLLPRLEDPEPYVVAGSLEVIGIMCRHAGDFMSGRIEEVWPGLKRLYKTRARRAVERARGSAQVTAAGRADITLIVSSDRSSDAKSQPLEKYYVDAPSRIIWEAMVTALTDIIAHTATNDVLFDEVLDMLVPLLDSRPEVRKALDMRNADAVWLALFRRRTLELARGSGPADGIAKAQQRQPMAGSRYPFAALA